MKDRSEELARIRERARTETRDDATIRAMAIAKARGETYSKERHGPFDALPTRVKASPAPLTDSENALADLLERFESRGHRPNRYLDAA